MKDIKIIIASHIPCRTPDEDLYVPVQVNAFNSVAIEGFIPDSTGDNISDRNPEFSELTALYWAWKNLDYDWLGLVHYRRYFSLRKSGNNSLENVLTREQLEPMLGKYKVFVPQKRHYIIETVYSHYSITFEGIQLDTAKEVLQEKYPEYVRQFEKVMNSRSAYIYNIMIMPRKLMDDYCGWLFDILFEVDRRIDNTGMTDFERRFAGRISERLFNVWLEHNIEKGVITKSEIKELPYIFLGKVNWKGKVDAFLKAKFCGKKYEKSF